MRSGVSLSCVACGSPADSSLVSPASPWIGTSLIALPTDIAEIINNQIGAKKNWAGQYTVECDTIKSLPDLTLYFGGKPYTLTAEDYILQVQGTCLSAFTGIDIPGTPLWIIGDVFLRKYYTVYDKGRDAVGFATST